VVDITIEVEIDERIGYYLKHIIFQV